ncbi:tRNA-queuosine alpha-mannosyltransferase domain-containing protein [Candidatus Viridilinea mediisalina]|uniref:tRNA-queuosine alpha-mannosyltransferase n=1 Tax=Candidatus Viridilinea mediisalina TaxID=2024553 RepID=A0A2A6RJN9_9CHLR|nr:DUF3524 domain-containing protein [Candidatus Viridilinea mediisalina]PDW03163.1 glycosyl transferase family 1 [Candidatus Viridilinea mediisalina]
MHILWLDPFHGGSHAAVAAGYAARSAHQVTLLTLPTTGGWRWRMRGGAVTLARLALALPQRPDLIVASDMLDLATFRALTSPQFAGIPALAYFHENQLTYPLPAGRQRDLSFAWINYTTALVADGLLFNSAFHRQEFLAALPGLLGRYHDFRELETLPCIAAKSEVLPPGIDLAALDGPEEADALTGPPVILWNARWDYDKQPGVFFAALEHLAAQGVDFGLIVVGEQIDPRDASYLAAKARWAAQTLHWGYAPTRASYGALLRRSALVVSTAIQEFFGIGVLEAMYCGCAPVLPNRLNYPALLPSELHAAWLYTGDAEDLAETLAHALIRCRSVPRRTWRKLAERYDWAQLVVHYDPLLGKYGSGSTHLDTPNHAPV